MVFDGLEAVERIWSRDANLWTGETEALWLGWLDVAERMQLQLSGLSEFAQGVAEDGFENFVLIGMGGSSLAPEVMRRFSGSKSFYVLDSTHPVSLLSILEKTGVEKTLFVVASKSGTTIETLAHFDFFWDKSGARGNQFVAITDPGSALESLASECGFRATFLGEEEVGGRYSALSVFGLVPCALMGLDLGEIVSGALSMADACRRKSINENPGLSLGLDLGNGWIEGRDKVVLNSNFHGFGLWVEQLIAESTGKDKKGLVPCLGENPVGLDRQNIEIEFDDIAGLGSEFFRFEFATAIAGAVMRINPFNQPNVQESKDRTAAVLASREQLVLERFGSLDSLLESSEEGDYLALMAFVPSNSHNEEVLNRVKKELGEKTALPVTMGFGPRYLHSTGQLHKGGSDNGLFIQVVDDPPELDIPGRDYGFHQLIRAQAVGDFEALLERGRRAVRITWDDLYDLC